MAGYLRNGKGCINQIGRCKDCSAFFELEVKERHCPGNHTLFVGEVVSCGLKKVGTPLSTIDYEGMYVGKD